MPPSADFGARSIGKRVNRVMPGSNAERVGLKAGDVLLRVNDRSVAAASDVAEALADEPPGSKIALMVARDNAPVELERHLPAADRRDTAQAAVRARRPVGPRRPDARR